MYFNADPSSAWAQIAARLPYMAPTLLVEVVGIVLALVLARRRVGPALCVILALGAMLVVGVVCMLARETLVAGVYRGERFFDDIRPILIAIGVLESLVHAGAIGLLVVAALAWRRRNTHTALAS
ncbi:MAG: hypothetical protein R3B57_13310 [Phycisphaerales bacterium]